MNEGSESIFKLIASLIIIAIILMGSHYIIPYLPIASVIGGVSVLPATDSGLVLQDTSQANWKRVTNGYLVIPVTVNQLDKMWAIKIDQDTLNSLGGIQNLQNAKILNSIEIDIEPLTPKVYWGVDKIIGYVVCNSAKGQYAIDAKADWQGKVTFTTKDIVTAPLTINYYRITSPAYATLETPFRVTVKIDGQSVSSQTLNKNIKSYDYFPVDNSQVFEIDVGTGKIKIERLGVLTSNQYLPSDIAQYVFLPYSYSGKEVTDKLGNSYLVYKDIQAHLKEYEQYWFGSDLDSSDDWQTATDLNGTQFTKPGWKIQHLTYDYLGSHLDQWGASPLQPSLMQDQQGAFGRDNHWFFGIIGPEVNSYYRIRDGYSFLKWLDVNYGMMRLNVRDKLQATFGNLLNWYIDNPNSDSPKFVAELSPTMYTNYIAIKIPLTVANVVVYQEPLKITNFQIVSPSDNFDFGKVKAGEETRLDVTVKNTGNQRGTAIVRVSSDKLFVSPSSNSITLDPGQTGTVSFMLRTGSVTTEATYKTIKIELYSEGGATALQTIWGSATLEPRTSLIYISSATLDPPEIPPNSFSKLKVSVLSQGGGGTSSCTVKLAISSGPFSVTPLVSSLTLNPGEEKSIEGIVSTTATEGNGILSVTLYDSNGKQIDQTSVQLKIQYNYKPLDFTIYYVILIICGAVLIIAGLWYRIDVMAIAGVGLFVLGSLGIAFGNYLINTLTNAYTTLNALFGTGATSGIMIVLFGVILALIILLVIAMRQRGEG